jgi:2-keto-3-deoxy-L-rhamnonate aldolase RhmA
MNAINRLLENRPAVLGAFLSEVAAPNLLRVMKAANLDFVIVDCEHGPFDFSQVAALAAVGNGIGLPVIVRIPSASREHVQKYLDAGADGLLLPMTNTARQAIELVRYGKYAPLGKRGISVTRPHSEYDPGGLTDYLARANDRVMLFVQIETAEGVENAAQIAATEGIDGLLIGPNDLAADYGNPGDFDQREVREALRTVAQAAAQAGKPSGIISTKMDLLRDCQELGMQVFSCNSEVGLLYKGIKGMVSNFLG